jgi:hypothetical protein
MLVAEVDLEQHPEVLATALGQVQLEWVRVADFETILDVPVHPERAGSGEAIWKLASVV